MNRHFATVLVWFCAPLLVTCLWAGATSPTRVPVNEPTVLTARCVASVPTLDGALEPVWSEAEPTVLDLMYGRHSVIPVATAEMRALYTADTLYLAVSWPQAEPPGPDGTAQNKLIVHFEVPAPWQGAADVMCLTACHTAYIDAGSQASYLTAETIPPGMALPLPVGGGWQGGQWAFEWGRPLVSENPYDVQFTDLSAEYTFFVKIVEGQPAQPDPVSGDILLRFGPRL